MVRGMCAAFLAGFGSREGYSTSKALAIASSGIPISCVWLGKHIATFSLGRRQSRWSRSAEFGPSLVAVRAALSIACASVGQLRVHYGSNTVLLVAKLDA